MSAFGARLFVRLQDAEFYRRLHAEAAEVAGPGTGKTWLDIGCGRGSSPESPLARATKRSASIEIPP